MVGSNNWGDRKHRPPDCVKYWARKDTKQAERVPLELQLDIIAGVSGPSQATGDIRTDLVFQLFAVPRTKDDPIVLETDVEYGTAVRGGSSVDVAVLTPDCRKDSLIDFGG